MEQKIASSENLRDFNNLFIEPRHEHVVRQIPVRRLEQWLDEGVSDRSQEVIKAELDRRKFNRPAKVSVGLSLAALLLSVIALLN